MASYTRLGSYLLANELTLDPSGKIYRGVTLIGSKFDRHHLLRTFSAELLEAGLGARLGEAQRVVGLLAGARGFGANYHVETGKAPLVACENVPGRSLAQMLKKTREEEIPLGVEHALSVIQGMAHALIQLHGKGVQHGTLSPHSVWVSFEGGTLLLDAPYAAILQPLLAKAPALQAALAPYQTAVEATPLQQDLFALGAVFYELLTLEQLPAHGDLAQALAGATLKASQEEAGLPKEILGLLHRLLMLDRPFTTVASFNEDLEKVLYDGEYSPTTFTMAFFMHTVFREENDLDAQAIKGDLDADYTRYLSSTPPAMAVAEGAPAAGPGRLVLIGASVAAVLLVGFLYVRHLKRQNDALQAGLQQQQMVTDNMLKEIAKQQDAQLQLQDQLAKKATEGKTAEERSKAKKDLEEAKKKSEELNKQKDEVLKKKQELTTKTVAPAPAPEPPKPEPAKVVEAPRPEPVKVTAPPPPAPAPVAQAAPTPAEVVEVPPTITRKEPPVAPRNASKSFLPPALRDSEIRVSLRVLVDPQGRPIKVMILNGIDGPLAYNEAAQKAALGSSYAPGTRNGKPTSQWLNLEYNFGKAR